MTGRTVSRRRLITRRVGVIALIALVVTAGVYFPATLLAPVAPSSAVVTSFKAPSQTKLDLSFPSYGATAVEALGFERSLTTSGDTKPRSIASISKIVTALVVLDKRPLNGGSGPTVTATTEDHALYASYLALDGEVAPMPVGLKLSEKQMLQVALIKSANNYAGALALWAFGSQKAYAQAATKWLRAHDLDDTTIVEPTGLNPANKSTATDLVRLGKLALADNDVASIVSTKKIDVPVVGTVENSNKLLGVDDVVGIKTGTLDQAGACLLFATRETMQGHEVTVVGVMLGGKDHDSLDVDVQKLLAGVQAGFQTVHAVAKGDVYGTYATKWGTTAHAEAARDVDDLVYGDVAVSAKITTRKITTASTGTKVGSLTVRIGEKTTEVPLVLDHAIEGPDAWWRITNPDPTF